MQSGPYWIAFGDIHDNVARLGEIADLAGAAGVIITGDITIAGRVKQAERVLDAIAAINPRILAQIGNMDHAEITDWLDGKGWNIHVDTRVLAPGVALMGVGASTVTPFGTPSEYPEARFAGWLQTAHEHVQEYPQLVLVSHQPPYGTACDRVGGGKHVGSTAVREFIERVQPAVCLCGHIHESAAVDTLGRTVVVNPGTLQAGGYARLWLEGGVPQVTLCSLGCCPA